MDEEEQTKFKVGDKVTFKRIEDNFIPFNIISLKVSNDYQQYIKHGSLTTHKYFNKEYALIEAIDEETNLFLVSYKDKNERKVCLGFKETELISIEKNNEIDKQNNEVKKMEKPNTNLEKNALKEAKEELIRKEIENKKRLYKENLDRYILYQNDATKYQKIADELAEKLNITDKEKKELFE